MGKTRGMGAGFKVKKLRIRQIWAHKKSHAKGIVPKKKLGINQTLVDKQYEESYIPYYPRPPFLPYGGKCAAIQLIKSGNKITMKYIGKTESASNNSDVLDTFLIKESTRFILS